MIYLYRGVPEAARPEALARLVRSSLRRRARKGALRLAQSAADEIDRDSVQDALNEPDSATLLVRTERAARRDAASLRREL